MSDRIKLDLPSEAVDGEVALLLDGSSAFSIQIPQGAGYVWTEKYTQKKNSFTPLAIGTESSVRANYYLVKEQNFRDIGGGFFTFDRLYANLPNTWNDTNQFAFNYVAERTVITSGEEDTTIEFFETSKSAQVSTKVSHSYSIGYPSTTAVSLADPVYAVGSTIAAGTTVRPKEVQVYMGNIYETRTFTLIKSFSA